MLEWLWTMNTNKLLACMWLDVFLGGLCCSKRELYERRYEECVERFDRIERSLSRIEKKIK